MTELKKLSFSRDLELLLIKHRDDHVTVENILEDLNYRSHGVIVMILSIPFILPMPFVGLSTVFGLIMMISAISIMSGLNPWLPKSWRSKTIPRQTLVRLIEKSEKVAMRLEKLVRPRLLPFSKPLVWVRIHGLMIFLSALILAIPLPPGGNVLPGAATLILALGLVEEDGVVLALGYTLTLVNIVLVTLIVVYGLDWLLSFF